MTYNEIDQLLKSYLEGETSLEEEKILRDFFARGDLPARYKPYAEMFEGFREIASAQMSDPHFDKKWSRKVKQQTGYGKRLSVFTHWYTVAGIAATLLLTVVLFVPVKKLPVIKQFSHRIEDTFDNPRQAYAETVKALLMVSDKFNAGTNQMEDLTKLDKGLEKTGKMLTFNKGLDEASKLSKFNENQLKETNL
ncbi:MAG: hypothetical protein PHD25_02235 [Bacteroidales bacterium]|nr:hypothetical protein [Bacteroidales bacterium]